MQFKTLLLSHSPLHNPSLNLLRPSSSKPFKPETLLYSFPLQIHRKSRLFSTSCIDPAEGLTQSFELSLENDGSVAENDNFGNSGTLSAMDEGGGGKSVGELENPSIWNQMKEIILFTGPAMGLWICGPIMSLIDTAVIGQGSSIELAALGPATVLCDNTSYVFMFLSIATSNMVATSLAKKDTSEVQHRISLLLCVGLVCGVFMFYVINFLVDGCSLWRAVGRLDMIMNSYFYSFYWAKEYAPCTCSREIYSDTRLGVACNSYWMGCSKRKSWHERCLGTFEGFGDIVLCSYMGYGIAGAAWATMISQVIAAYMMVEALNKKGYNAYALSIPSSSEILEIASIAAPVLVSIVSKVAFYSLLAYYATDMGTYTAAAHQVMLQTYLTCTVFGEPLSQTAQSFMPELLYGINRSLTKARLLLRSLLIIGASVGLITWIIGTSVPWFFPNLFTSDPAIIVEMHKLLAPYFIALSGTACTLSLEGTLMAGRELKFCSLSMSSCLCVGAIVVTIVNGRGYGLPGCWYSLVGFQWARFFLALQRLLSPNGILYSDERNQYEQAKLKAA